MNSMMKTGFVACAALAAVAIAGGVFIESGLYDIGADDHHTKIVLAIIEEMRERSVDVRARAVEAQDLADPEEIAAGARHYEALCAGCHLAPGVTKSDLRPGLYPTRRISRRRTSRTPRGHSGSSSTA
jgi:cytochrome c553